MAILCTSAWYIDRYMWKLLLVHIKIDKHMHIKPDCLSIYVVDVGVVSFIVAFICNMGIDYDDALHICIIYTYIFCGMFT